MRVFYFFLFLWSFCTFSEDTRPLKLDMRQVLFVLNHMVATAEPLPEAEKKAEEGLLQIMKVFLQDHMKNKNLASEKLTLAISLKDIARQLSTKKNDSGRA